MAGRHNSSNQYFFSPLEKQNEDFPKSDCKLFDSENNQTAMQKILLNKAETCEEKFKILDARDKLYKLMQYSTPILQRKALPATCPDMCPEKERLLREYQGRGSIFEMTNFSRNSVFNHSLAVKEYARSSADQEEPLPHELRPISVLSMTMSHLLHNVVDYCELSDDGLEDWYMFMWDRTRALRKELTQQGLCSLESVTLVEQCARFHIHCAERLIDQDSSIYDDKINTENLTKCLQTLKYMYKDLAKEDIKCPNEPEFVCYTLLLNLNNSSVFTELSDMSDSLMESSPVKFALDIMTTWETKNYIRFFDLIKKASYLNCCLLRRYFGEMRLYAVKTMIRSYCTKNYSPQIPLARFVKNLNFEGEEECLNFLGECNFNFLEGGGVTAVNFNRLLFQNPENTYTKGRAFIFIEEKKTRPLSVILAGGTLPPKTFENHIPENSFTENDYLKSEILAKFDLTDASTEPLAPTTISQSSPFAVNDGKCEEAVSPVTTNIEISTVEVPAVTNIFEIEKPKESTEESSSSKMAEKPSFLNNSLFSAKNLDSSKNIFNSFQNVPAFSSAPVAGILEENKRLNVSESQSKILFGSIQKVNPFETKAFQSTKSDVPFQFRTNDDLKNGVQSNQFLPSVGFEKTVNENKETEKASAVPNNDFNKSFNFSFKAPDCFSSFKFKQTESYEPLSCRNENLVQEKRKLHSFVDEEFGKKKVLKMDKNEEEEDDDDEGEEEEEEKRRKKEIEESKKRELEKKEREKQEEEEKSRKEQRIRLEMEEIKRKEEIERQEKMRKLEENKRKEEVDYRLKIDKKMCELKRNWDKWKMKIVFDKWRINTWSKVEERKMRDYMRDVKVKYPPVCTEELLDSNPYGLIIPNTLVLEKFQNWKKDYHRNSLKQKQKLLIISDDLPLLKINSILGKFFEARIKSLPYKADSYPWKLIISVPDESESPKFSKSIEIFVEMHFVCDRNWEFGVQKGPLYCQKGTYKSMNFHVSVRRLRGCDLYEGNETNPSAIEGSNVVIFVLNGKGNEKSRERLKAVVKSRSFLPKIPVILFAFSDDTRETDEIMECLEVEKLQKLHSCKCHVFPVVNGQHDVVGRFIECLNLAAKISLPPSSLRLSHLSDFFSESRLDSIWRRIGISLSNFRIVLEEPKILIEFYNSCIDYLTEVFLDDSYNKQSVLGEEFSEIKLKRPKNSVAYAERLKKVLSEMKLPRWPVETPKSSHQLNYRIHQYCKKIVGVERLKVKNFKWRLYSIIRRALLWKGLDIYCDEDIHELLINFPWIEVFQEISRLLLYKFKEEVKNDENLVVVYDLEKMEDFSFETSLISKLLKSTKRKALNVGREEEFRSKESSPCPENDSVVYAYYMALERERNKRKREECREDSLDGLFSSPSEKRLILDKKEKDEIMKAWGGEDEEDETESANASGSAFSQIKCNFQCLNDRLDELKRQTAENESILMSIYNQFK